MMKYNTVFFDLDDTLIDTNKNSYQTLSEIYIHYRLNEYYSDFDFFARKYQKINNDLWNLYEIGEINKDELQTQRFYLTLKGEYKYLTKEKSLQINKTFMTLVSEKTNVIQNTIEVLDYLKQKGYKLNILSNGFNGVQQKKLINAGINNYFDHIILSDFIGKNKPHPDLFDYALNITDASRENSIMIGDNINTDIQGAKMSNINQVWFNPRQMINNLGIIPTYEISELISLKKIL